MKNNQVKLVGIVAKELKELYSFDKEKFFGTTICVKRHSGTEDKLAVIIPSMIATGIEQGMTVEVTGSFRSRNVYDGNVRHKELYVFADSIEVVDDAASHMNEITLNGFVTNPPIYRETPLGREITDLCVAVNRDTTTKADYINCITWGRNARNARDLSVGTNLLLTGRIQSREYSKKLSEDKFETRTAYEVSIVSMAEIGGKNEKN